MRGEITIRKYGTSLHTYLNEFFLKMGAMDVEYVFDALSPNLKQLAMCDKHKDKYQSAFIFGRKLISVAIYSITETQPGIHDCIIPITLAPEGYEDSDGPVSDDDIKYRAYKIRLIEIDEYWFIDDFTLYNDFYKNEFKDFAQSEGF